VNKADGDRLITKQTRQITRVGAVGCTNYSLNNAQAGNSRSADKKPSCRKDSPPYYLTADYL